jgi:hypothetical protein
MCALRYVVLGDFSTAVAFLLASSPEKSGRYYRDALVTAALAAAANARQQQQGKAGPRALGTPLQLQVSRVKRLEGPVAVEAKGWAKECLQ